MGDRCEVWGLVQCPRLAVDTLVFCNANINRGELAVCQAHLDVELKGQLLRATPPTLLTPKTPVDRAMAATDPGWPRAMIRTRWRSRTYPLPWINGWKPMVERHGFKELNTKRNNEAERDRLCFCCGEPLLELSLMGRHRASFEVWLTDGPAGHPRCMALAVEYCPHLRKQHRGDPDFVIAYAWRGKTIGYVETPTEMMMDGTPRRIVRPGATEVTLAEVRELAERCPLG
jgi:hypothetical protein